MENLYDPKTGICNSWKKDQDIGKYRCFDEGCPWECKSLPKSEDGLIGCTVNGKIPLIHQRIEESKLPEIPLEEQVLND